MKVAVTGATGFVGRQLCASLARAGHEALPLDLRRESWRPCDAVVHLAAVAHRRAGRDEIDRVNVGMAKALGHAAASHGAALVFLSSVKVHGEASKLPLTEGSPLAPREPYAASKAAAEDALRAIAGLRLAVLRPPLVYGPEVKANFLALMRAIARGLPLPLASVQNRRSLIYVGNLASAILCCLGRQGTFLVSDGGAVSTPQLCRALGAALARPVRLFPFPPSLLPSSLAGSLEVDGGLIRQALGWQPPLPFEEGLNATVRWYRGR